MDKSKNNELIPKTIHYCWFGRSPLPPLATKCIESWKKYLPDYEIKEWNEDNFDVNMLPYTKEAYEAKKYAFVSDFARFWILYKYGGLYFDTDVEVIKPLDEIIARGPFMGCEKDSNNIHFPKVAPGLGLGAWPEMIFYKEMIDSYKTLHFLNEDGTFNHKTVVDYTTEFLCKHGLQNISSIQKCGNIWIYPKIFFNPMTPGGKIIITDKTHSIHHYAGTWIPFSMKVKKFIIELCGDTLWSKIQSIRGKRI
jgi:mannosyltransferase OCH1-like enzyme